MSQVCSLPGLSAKNNLLHRPLIKREFRLQKILLVTVYMYIFDGNKIKFIMALMPILLLGGKSLNRFNDSILKAI